MTAVRSKNEQIKIVEIDIIFRFTETDVNHLTHLNHLKKEKEHSISLVRSRFAQDFKLLQSQNIAPKQQSCS